MSLSSSNQRQSQSLSWLLYWKISPRPASKSSQSCQERFTMWIVIIIHNYHHNIHTSSMEKMLQVLLVEIYRSQEWLPSRSSYHHHVIYDSSSSHFTSTISSWLPVQSTPSHIFSLEFNTSTSPTLEFLCIY